MPEPPLTVVIPPHVRVNHRGEALATVASFKLNNGFIKLSLMPNGKWGFHL